VAAAEAGGARFSVVLTKTPRVNRAIAAIDQNAGTPVRYPGAVRDPDTGELISDAEVAEIEHTAFTSTNNPVTARLIVRRVRDRNHHDTLFPVWRYHPFFTDNPQPIADVDITHRRHASSRPCSPTSSTDRSRTWPRRLRRELGLGDLRRDGPQPAARRRHPDSQSGRPGNAPATTADQRVRQTRPSATPAQPASAHPLALDPAVAHVVAQHLPHQTRTAHRRVTLPNRPPRPRTHPEKLARPANHPRPQPAPGLSTHTHSNSEIISEARPRIEA
jgi:hypothetical protein